MNPRRRRLIVLANRLPVHRAGHGAPWQRSPGGLVTAMEPVLSGRDVRWIGWSGSAGRAPRPFRVEDIELRPVSISAREEDLYYDGMSNRTLWPLYHDAIRTPEFHRDWWNAYQEVNIRFARAAARTVRRGDLVWIHDYHLQLVPRLLRQLRPDARIGFFLHIPFPPEELFAWLPWRQSLLHGLLGADVVGFQTPENAQNFSRVARRYTSAEGTDWELDFEGRPINVRCFPISIDAAKFETLASTPHVQAEARAIRRRLGPVRKMVLCVDRLDYTKGIDARLRAYEELLRRGDITPEQCVLVQIAVPSRERVPEYDEIRTTVEQTVGRINGEYSLPGQVAVHYFRRSLSHEQLVSYYLAADVMLVTPLRDGMNLVAKEYIATRTDNSGVLVLSEFAGAAKELRRAVLVNPRDVDGLAGAILTGLRMPKEDARQRMAILRMQVRRHDVEFWSRGFLDALTP
jgi:trehalose 6-phosphate synthase